MYMYLHCVIVIGSFSYAIETGSRAPQVAVQKFPRCTMCIYSMPEVPYKYFMTVSPLDGKLYVSDYQSKQIMRVKTMGAVRELDRNYEVVAGNGEQCVPGEKGKCGDDAKALNAKLFYPKGGLRKLRLVLWYLISAH